MSQRIEITEAFFRLLAKSSAAKRKILLAGATNEQLKGLFEICLNLIRGNLPFGVKEKKRFVESVILYATWPTDAFL